MADKARPGDRGGGVCRLDRQSSPSAVVDIARHGAFADPGPTAGSEGGGEVLHRPECSSKGADNRRHSATSESPTELLCVTRAPPLIG